MKKQVITLVAVLGFSNSAFAQESPASAALEVFSTNRMVSFDATKELNLKFWLQQLMLSALYRNEVQDSSLDEWKAQLSSSTRLHCRYPSVATLAIPERESLNFQEALLPLPSDRYPGYIFIKHGQRVQRLAKYDPWLLHKLVSEANLSLYENLAKVERGLF
jgi:hypothetical protein